MNSIRLFNTDKLLVITNNKIASRYVGHIMSMQTDIKVPNVQFGVNDEFEVGSDTRKKDKQFISIQKDWDALNSKNIKKDILFLYRDPAKRGPSGIIQEFNSEVFSHRGAPFLLKVLLEEYNSKSIDLYDDFCYLSGAKVDTNDVKELLKKEQVRDAYKFLLEKYLMFDGLDLLNKVHVYPYMQPLYYYLNSNKIDLNKVSLIDIDTNSISLDPFLQKYSIDTEISVNNEKNTNKFFKEIFDEIVRKSNDKRPYLLKSFIKSYNRYVDKEKIYYEKLLSMKQNYIHTI